MVRNDILVPRLEEFCWEHGLSPAPAEFAAALREDMKKFVNGEYHENGHGERSRSHLLLGEWVP